MTFSKHAHLKEASHVLLLIVAKALHGSIQMEYHTSDIQGFLMQQNVMPVIDVLFVALF